MEKIWKNHVAHILSNQAPKIFHVANILSNFVPYFVACLQNVWKFEDRYRSGKAIGGTGASHLSFRRCAVGASAWNVAGNGPLGIHPQKINHGNLKIAYIYIYLKRKTSSKHFQTIIFRFELLIFRGVTCLKRTSDFPPRLFLFGMAFLEGLCKKLPGRKFLDSWTGYIAWFQGIFGHFGGPLLEKNQEALQFTAAGRWKWTLPKRIITLYNVQLTYIHLRLFQHTELEHTPKPLPTGHKGIPFIVV